MRGTGIMERDFNVKHISANVDPIGRSSLEVLRLLRALNYYDAHGEVCPVNFERGSK
jgi:peroxiredoxin (alkyl hydroperoxide reductase subunit C)